MVGKHSTAQLHTAALPDTPLGPMIIQVTDHGLARIEFQETVAEDLEVDSRNLFAVTPLLLVAMEQLRDYLDGRRREFDLPIDWRGMTAFQQRVLSAALTIPYGQTSTYGDLAFELGQPGASRAVGVALGKNPMPIVIPCHRVMGNQGRLQGYSAPDGLNKKVWLLKLEGILLFG